MRTVHLFERTQQSADKTGLTFDYKAESACKKIRFTCDDTKPGADGEARAVECFADHRAPNMCQPCVESHVEDRHRFPALIA